MLCVSCKPNVPVLCVLTTGKCHVSDDSVYDMHVLDNNTRFYDVLGQCSTEDVRAIMELCRGPPCRDDAHAAVEFEVEARCDPHIVNGLRAEL